MLAARPLPLPVLRDRALNHLADAACSLIEELTPPIEQTQRWRFDVAQSDAERGESRAVEFVRMPIHVKDTCWSELTQPPAIVKVRVRPKSCVEAIRQFAIGCSLHKEHVPPAVLPLLGGKHGKRRIEPQAFQH